MLKICVKITNEASEETEEIILLNEQNHLTREGFLLCAVDLLTDVGLFAILFAVIKKCRKK